MVSEKVGEQFLHLPSCAACRTSKEAEHRTGRVSGAATVAQKSHGGQPEDRVTEGKTWKESQKSSNLVVLKERSPDPQAPEHHLETC